MRPIPCLPTPNRAWRAVGLWVLVSFFLFGPAPQAGAAPRARHIILFIGDGMQLEHEIAASRYLFGSSDGLAFHQLPFRAPVSTWDVTTYNAAAARAGRPAYDPGSFLPELGYSPELGGAWPFPIDPNGSDYYLLRVMGATDSASAATAWATGQKTDSSRIAWRPGDPANGPLKTIAELLRDNADASIGVVSTVPFTHATPAAHVAHNVSRNHYYTGFAGYTGLGIAEEIVFHTRPDVVIGGGHPLLNNPGFSPYAGYVSRTVYEALKDGGAGYLFVERQPGVDGAANLLGAARVAAAGRMKLFGLFGGADGAWELPQPSNTPGQPSVTRGNLENPLLKHATIAALDVLAQNPAGFFVAIEQGQVDWANHAHNYPGMVGAVWDLHEAVSAAIRFVERPGDRVTWDNTLLVVTADHANSYLRLARNGGEPVLGPGELPAQTGYIGFDAQSNPVRLPAGAAAYYGASGHTDELVMLYARGCGVGALARRRGAWYPGTAIIDNTQIFDALVEASALQDPAQAAGARSRSTQTRPPRRLLTR